jgi:hypothetical protein
VRSGDARQGCCSFVVRRPGEADEDPIEDGRQRADLVLIEIGEQGRRETLVLGLPSPGRAYPFRDTIRVAEQLLPAVKLLRIRALLRSASIAASSTCHRPGPAIGPCATSASGTRAAVSIDPCVVRLAAEPSGARLRARVDVRREHGHARLGRENFERIATKMDTEDSGCERLEQPLHRAHELDRV